MGGDFSTVRIVFFGTPDAAVPALQHLVEVGHEIALVVTRPDRPVGRSDRPVASPVKRFALDAGLTVDQPEKVRTRNFRDRVGACKPDLLAVVAFGRILSLRLIEQTPLGAVNLHFSLLPRYRGAAPVQWALAHGDRTTGVTTIGLNEALDEGDTLLRKELPIRAGEHAPALFERLAAIGAPILADTIDGLASGTIEPTPQRHEDATHAPILARDDGWIDPSGLEARFVEGRIRGFDPWPGVWLKRGRKRLRLVQAEELDDTTLLAPDAPLDEPGRLIAIAAGGVALVCAGRTALRLIAVQPDGRSAISVADALNGRQIAIGERLEPVRTH
ncbi:MAG: methionyl-tRNA formyltransferase [Acidobacteriota bacterium]